MDFDRGRPPSQVAGNLAASRLLSVSRPDDREEREARTSVADRTVASRARLASRVPAARVHVGVEAKRSALALGARAYTIDRDIFLDETAVDLSTRSGRSTLAHELVHATQRQGVIRRQTAEEIKRSFESSTLGFTDLDEDGLGSRLATLALSGQAALARRLITILDSSDRDDVSQVAVGQLSIPQLIGLTASDDGRSLLATMRAELSSGFDTADEADKADLLEAILEAGPSRTIRNRRRIRALQVGTTDLEGLATMFSDDSIVDDGTVPGRVRSILDATEHLVVPGLQTGIEFADTGFRGEPTPTGSGFRDPHPSSRNQVGHFLTAVGLEFSPEVVSRPIPVFGTVRAMVGAPVSMSDADVALRLTIGHEKSRDPNGGAEVLVNVLFEGLLESFSSGPEGETEGQRDERVGRAMTAEAESQVREIIAAFRAQFAATSDADVAAWNEALERFRRDGAGLEGPDSPLERIAVNPALKGNSRQDLRLSLVGWALGEKIRAGAFSGRAEVADFIRRSLGNQGP